LVSLLFLVAFTSIQTSSLPFSNAVQEFAIGDVYQVPMHPVTDKGSIDLPTPNRNEEYELILYSLNLYHEHTKITLDPSDYPEGQFSFTVSLGDATNTSAARAPAIIPATSGSMDTVAGQDSQTGVSMAPAYTARSLGETRTFKIDHGRDSIKATLRRMSEISYVWVDDRVLARNFNVTDAEYLGRIFDETIFPREVELFGNPAPNPDGDPHIAIVFTLLNVTIDEFDTPHGYNTNRRNILFLYTPDPEGQYGDYVKGIPKERVVKEFLPLRIAHVLNHLLIWSQHVDLRGGPNEYLGIWEGLANLAEYIALGNLGLTEPRSSITIFLRKPEIHSVLDRTTGWLAAHTAFIWYLYEIGGTEVIKKLSQTDKVGPANIEAATGREFAQVFRDWTAAMFLSNTDLNYDPKYHFKILNLRSLRSRGPSEIALNVENLFEGQIRSTGAYYFRLRASPQSRMLSVTIEGQPASQLQASVIRLSPSFSIIADIPRDAYEVNGISLDSSIPSQLALGQKLVVSGSVNDTRAREVFIGVGPQDGPTLWQNNGPAVWWTLAPVEKGRFSAHMVLGIPNRWCSRSLELGDYRLSITYRYDQNYAPEKNFPSIRIVSKCMVSRLETSLSLEVPNSATQGQTITIVAALKDETGQSIEGATLDFYVKAGGDTIRLGSATTNASGSASILYVPTTVGDIHIEVAYGGNENYAESHASAILNIRAVTVQPNYLLMAFVGMVAVMMLIIGLVTSKMLRKRRREAAR